MSFEKETIHRLSVLETEVGGIKEMQHTTYDKIDALDKHMRNGLQSKTVSHGTQLKGLWWIVSSIGIAVITLCFRLIEKSI